MSYKLLTMKLGSTIFYLAAFSSACGGRVPAQSAGARGIALSEDAPPASYVRLGELSVKSGKGCGVMGESGSREGAEGQLRNEAEKLGATYVQLTSYEPPRPNHQCLEHEYKLSGIAYRSSQPAAPASAAPPAPPTPPTASEAPARACVPGATQACLGPGACSGAQACRDDASGFLPCDCGPAHP